MTAAQTGETLFGDDGLVPFYRWLDVHEPGARCSRCRKTLAGRYSRMHGHTDRDDTGRLVVFALCDECNPLGPLGGA